MRWKHLHSSVSSVVTTRAIVAIVAIVDSNKRRLARDIELYTAYRMTYTVSGLRKVYTYGPRVIYLHVASYKQTRIRLLTADMGYGGSMCMMVWQ